MTHGTIKIGSAQQPDWSDRAVRMDAGRACCRSPQILFCAEPGISFGYFLMPAPVYAYYDYDANLVL